MFFDSTAEHRWRIQQPFSVIAEWTRLGRNYLNAYVVCPKSFSNTDFWPKFQQEKSQEEEDNICSTHTSSLKTAGKKKIWSKRLNNITARFERIFVQIKHVRRTLYTLLRANFSRFRNISERGYQLRHACPSVLPSIRPSLCPVLTGRVFMKFGIRVFFENLSRKFKFHLNLTRKTGTLNRTYIHFLSYLTHFFLEWEIQSVHKVFPCLQTFITRKLRGIQTCNCNITINTCHNILQTSLSNGKKMFPFHVVFL